MFRFCFSDVGPSGGSLFHSHECRRKAEEADELAQKATDLPFDGPTKKSRDVGAKWRSALNGISGRPPAILLPNGSLIPCPLLAQSGHPPLHRTCPLSGVKQT